MMSEHSTTKVVANFRMMHGEDRGTGVEREAEQDREMKREPAGRGFGGGEVDRASGERSGRTESSVRGGGGET